jgi:hypothetical protein
MRSIIPISTKIKFMGLRDHTNGALPTVSQTFEDVIQHSFRIQMTSVSNGGSARKRQATC